MSGEKSVKYLALTTLSLHRWIEYGVGVPSPFKA